MTTHSPAFVSIEGLEGLVLVYKEDGSTRVRQLTRPSLVRKCIEMGVPDDRVNENNILPFYAANATSEILSGFFARLVVLVEGPTEALALPILLAKRGLEVEREGIAVLSVGGKGNLAKWYRLFSAYGISCYIVFDNDETDDSRGTKRNDALRAVGVSDETVEDLIQSDDWVVEDGYMIFGRDYETLMGRNFRDYNKLERRAAENGVSSKPFVARWVARQLDSESGDLGWEKVDQMIEALKRLLGARMDNL